MQKTSLLTAAMLLLTTVLPVPACSFGPSMVSASAAKRPQWTSWTPFTKQGRRFYVGHSTGAATLEEGRKLACAAAFRAMVQEIAVTVSEESHYVERETGGIYTYDVQFRTTTQSTPVTVKGVQTSGEYYEEWSRASREFDTWVLISLPVDEWKRAIRTAAGKVLVVWSCEADDSDACSRTLLEEILSTLTRNGRQLLPEIVTGPVKSNLAVLGASFDAAYVLAVSAHARFLQELNGEFFASAQAVARFIDTAEGKVLANIDTGHVKGGHYSRLDALKTALRKSCKELASRLELSSVISR